MTLLRALSLAAALLLSLPIRASAQQSPVSGATVAGRRVTIELRVPDEILSTPAAAGGSAAFKVVASDDVRLLGAASGVVKWRSGEEPLLLLTFEAPHALPPRSFQAALVIFTDPTGQSAAVAAEVSIPPVRRVPTREADRQADGVLALSPVDRVARQPLVEVSARKAAREAPKPDMPALRPSVAAAEAALEAPRPAREARGAPQSVREARDSQESPTAEAGRPVTVVLRVPDEIVGSPAAAGGTAYFKVVLSDDVRSLGATSGTVSWSGGEEPLLPLTLTVPRLPAGHFQAALVIFTGPTGRSAAVAAEVRIAATRRVHVELDSALVQLRSGGQVTLGYRLENLGNGEDTLRVKLHASPGLRVSGLPGSLVLPAFGVQSGELTVEAAPGIRSGGLVFVRLNVPDRGHRATATTHLAVTNEPGWLPDLVHMPATIYVGSSVSTGQESNIDPVAAIQGGGQIARNTDLWFAYRHLPEVGSPVFRGYEYGPRLQLGVRHRSLELTLGDLVLPTSSLAGYYLQGLGGGIRWLGNRTEIGAYLARPRNPNGSTEGHLALAQGYHHTRLGTLGLLLSDVEGRLTLQGSTTRQSSGLLRYRWEEGGTHWGFVDAGWVRSERESLEPISGPALDAGYLLRTPNTSAEVRVRMLPEGAQVAGLPAQQLRLGGSQTIAGPISVTALAFDERASFLQRLKKELEPDPIDPELPLPPIRAEEFADQRVQGLEGGFRYLDRGLRFDLLATVRNGKSELEDVEPSTRRTLRAGAGLPLGPVRFDGVAEVGESRLGEISELAQRYQGTLYWYGREAWARMGLLYIQDLFIPRTVLVDAAGALRLSDRLELYGSVSVDWERPSLGEGLSARIGAQIQLLTATELFLGAESLPDIGDSDSRWRFSVGVRRALSLPLPVRRAPAVNGVVFEDRNGNGRREPGEPPIAKVRLIYGWDQAVTDVEGRFFFRQNTGRSELRVDPSSLEPDVLPPPLMTVPPAGYVEIPVQRAAYLRVAFYLDSNGDGQRGPDEGAAAGIAVGLRDQDGNLWEASASEAGVVEFSATRPGRYVLAVVETTLPPEAGMPSPVEVELLGGTATVLEIAVPHEGRRIRFTGEREGSREGEEGDRGRYEGESSPQP